MQRRVLIAQLAALSILSRVQASYAEITGISGAGSTFIDPILAKWIKQESEKNGIKIRYTAKGSGFGLGQLDDGKVQFAASDMPLDGARLQEKQYVQFPAVVGGVVPVVNIKGIEPGELKLSREVLADIFLGKITKWNDASILKDNSDNTNAKLRALSNADINVIGRSDPSGTTFNMADFIHKVRPNDLPKAATNTMWPTAYANSEKNGGVAGSVKDTSNAIGYVDYSIVGENNLTDCQVSNSTGSFVRVSLDSIGEAAKTAKWADHPDFNLVITDAPGKDAWPIAASTFIVLSKTLDHDVVTALFKFLDEVAWGEQGQKLAKDALYIPNGCEMIGQIAKMWDKEFPGWRGATTPKAAACPAPAHTP